MRQYELVERVTRYNPAADEGLLNKAYVYAMQKHGTQLRASGDPYFSHPLEVAAILTDLKLDDATIAVGLLHDTIEDTDATRGEIDAMFGEDIGRLVEGLTKIKKLDLVSKKAAQAENLRKLLLAISADIRVLLVKLADRLHNMRTLQFIPVARRIPSPRRRWRSTRLLPAAWACTRCARNWRSWRSASSILRRTRPSSRHLAELGVKQEGLIHEIEAELRSRFEERGIQAVIVGRQKRPYSIFRKMERKAVSFEQLSDISASASSCRPSPNVTRALGVIHTAWPNRSRPFQGLHLDAEAERISVDPHHRDRPAPSACRVADPHREMDKIAEYGIAAHALYKDGVGPSRNCPPTETARAAATLPASTPRSAPMNGCGAPSKCWRKGTRQRNFSSIPSSSCSRTRCSASRRRGG